MRTITTDITLKGDSTLNRVIEAHMKVDEINKKIPTHASVYGTTIQTALGNTMRLPGRPSHKNILLANATSLSEACKIALL